MISTTQPKYKVGNVTEAILAEARQAGLAEAGIHALVTGDVAAYRRELDALAARRPGSVWACLDGYALWYNSASPAALAREYDDLTTAAATLGHKGGQATSPAKVAAAKRNGAHGGRPKRVAEVTHGKRTIMGTDWPITSYVERCGPGRYLATYNLCNGVPSGTEWFRTLREAKAAIGAKAAAAQRNGAQGGRPAYRILGGTDEQRRAPYAVAASGPVGDNSTWPECFGIESPADARILAVGATAEEAVTNYGGPLADRYNPPTLYRRVGSKGWLRMRR